MKAAKNGRTSVGRMSPPEVASLADYLRQHHPDAFGRAAAQLGFCRKFSGVGDLK